MERSYKIAGLTVNMDTFGIALTHGRPYEIEYTDTPDLFVKGDRAAFKAQFPHRKDDFCEYTATAIDFYNKILDFDAMLLHSSAVIMDGKAYLFAADAGTGKSTHTGLYRRVFGDDRVKVLNDDKPVLRLEDGVFYAYGTPWSGKTDLNLNLRAPVGGICVLQRGEKNEICRLKGRQALFSLLVQTVRPEDKTQMDKLLWLMNELLASVKVWTMKCNMDPEAAVVSFETMSGMREEK